MGKKEGGGTRRAPSPPQCCYCRKSPPHTHSQPLCLLSIPLPSSLLSQLGRGLKAWPFSSPPPPPAPHHLSWARLRVARPLRRSLASCSSSPLLFLSSPFSSSSSSEGLLARLSNSCAMAVGGPRAAEQPGGGLRGGGSSSSSRGSRGEGACCSRSLSRLLLWSLPLHSCHIGRPPGSRRMLARPHRNFLLLEESQPRAAFAPQNPSFLPFFPPQIDPLLIEPTPRRRDLGVKSAWGCFLASRKPSFAGRTHPA